MFHNVLVLLSTMGPYIEPHPPAPRTSVFHLKQSLNLSQAIFGPNFALTNPSHHVILLDWPAVA